MRLTLRTLLAYLDDTLEPVQAREIGQKVAESDAARELVERIKQVTRRRRIAAPTVAGPGTKLDANTLAEYLDNEVSPETAAEVEAICLASDMHLAEVAACHQILTLVIGEPMSVPQPAKQRMYGLVKGPEAIPFRKPAAAAKEKGAEPAPAGRDLDDTLRLGLPPVGPQSSLASKILLFGGGFAAACLLLVAVWQVLNYSSGKKDDPADKALVQVNGKDKATDKDSATEKDKDAGKDKEKTLDKSKETKVPPAKTKDKDDENKDGKKDKDGTDEKKDKPGEAQLVDIAFADPDVKTVKAIGQYQPDEGKDTVVCLQEVTHGEWKRLTARNAEVTTGTPLLSLPGSWSSIYIPSGFRLTLCGNAPEILGQPIPLHECKLVLHHHDKLGLDISLLKGQFLVTNLKDKPMQVRVRFANPFEPDRPEHYEVLLHNKGTQMLFGLTSALLDGEPFYPDPKNPRRKGPVNFVACMVLKGFASVKFGDVTHGRGPLNLFQWNNLAGPNGPTEVKDANIALQEFPVPEGVDEKSKSFIKSSRGAMKKARDNLAFRLEGPEPVRVKLAEVLASTEPQKPLDPKAIALSRIMLGRLTIRSMGALGQPIDISSILEVLDPPANDDARRTARETLLDWLAADRDNDYVLYGLLEDKYRKVQSERIMGLMHGLSKKDLSDPTKYEELIELLDNSNAIVREMAAFRLYQAVPMGRGIPYSAWDTADLRRAAMDQWRFIIPPGSLPLSAPPKKKTK